MTAEEKQKKPNLLCLPLYIEQVVSALVQFTRSVHALNPFSSMNPGGTDMSSDKCSISTVN